MKIAQEIRAGNVIMHSANPWVVLKTEYARGGRNAATVRMKLKRLLNDQGAEIVFKADDKMDQVVLDKKECLPKWCSTRARPFPSKSRPASSARSPGPNRPSRATRRARS